MFPQCMDGQPKANRFALGEAEKSKDGFIQHLPGEDLRFLNSLITRPPFIWAQKQLKPINNRQKHKDNN